MNELPARRRLIVPDSCLRTIQRPLTGSWPGGSMLLQPRQHVRDGFPFPRILHVSRRLACASRAYDPVRGRPLPILVTGMPDVFVTIIESVRYE
ncbi:MAG: hypothetical protein KatS3mg056_3205 [Chloroflexus sp.]|uniref:hypothetical protein n=1 Tax=Chloroflexus aurantiacus TaxID=1108 RepID=UPI00005BA973|nr:hypothetical protein [Chloroflexus aurantiacus]GIV94496.1 MAG: hypothetical protein KatS3mg056_3205 [Chloroflexus sp.]